MNWKVKILDCKVKILRYNQFFKSAMKSFFEVMALVMLVLALLSLMEDRYDKASFFLLMFIADRQWMSGWERLK